MGARNGIQTTVRAGKWAADDVDEVEEGTHAKRAKKGQNEVILKV